ncbi:MAG: hypothetical protein AAGE85_12465 [Pseudomonadota bacterium]
MMMNSGEKNSVLTEEWLKCFESSGIAVTKVLAQEYDPDRFGNGEAIFESGALRFRIERDRLDDLLSVSFEPQMKRYYQLDDLRVVFGWVKPSEVAKRTEFPSLANQLREVGDNRDIFFERLTGPEAPFWRARIEDVEKQREQATLERFRRG